MPEPNKTAPQPEPNEKLVKIFDAEQENEAIVVQGLLQSAGIESDLKSIDAVQNAFPGVGGTDILVREEDATEAERIIAVYRKLPPLDDDTADITGQAYRGEESSAGSQLAARRCLWRTADPSLSHPSQLKRGWGPRSLGMTISLNFQYVYQVPGGFTTGQRAQCWGLTSTSGGSWTAQAAVRCGQRGSKGHPGGSWAMDGTVPSMVERGRARSVERVGMARSRP